MSIAITGIGIVSPAGLNPRATVDGLASGEAIQPDNSGRSLNTSCFARAPEFQLEPRLRFPKSIKFMNRSVQLAMWAALDAMEASGLTLTERDRSRVAIHTAGGETGLENEEFFPALSVAWKENEPDLKYLGVREARLIDPYFSLRTLANAGSGLIAMELGLHGTSCHFIHGEAAGAQALEAACQDLADRRCDVALAGAYDCLGATAAYLAYDAAGWARPAWEFLLGEGAAFVILERMEDAEARGAQISGRIMAVNCHTSGFGPVSDAVDFIVARGICENERHPGGAAPTVSFKKGTGYLGAATALVELTAGLALAASGRLVPAVRNPKGLFLTESWCGATGAITAQALG